MTSKRYQGNIISKTPVTPTASAASGVWSLTEAKAFSAAGLWPIQAQPGTALFTHGTLGGGGGYQNVITTLSLPTLGSSSDFGDLTAARSSTAAASSSTRGVVYAGFGTFGGGNARTNIMDYVTIASAGNATDFGDASTANNYPSGASNSTRAVFAVGYTNSGYSNVLDYITIASAGNATDFGDSTISAYVKSATSSSTRTCYAGGDTSGGRQNVIDYITIASTGNATDFGDLVEAAAGMGEGNCSTGVYGYFVGGRNASGTVLQTIQYITIASTGNASDYGDLSVGKRYQGQAGNTSRGLSIGGRSSTTNYTTSVEYFSLSTSGSGVSWGDLSTAGYAASALSDSHGGLS